MGTSGASQAAQDKDHRAHLFGALSMVRWGDRGPERDSAVSKVTQEGTETGLMTFRSELR